VVGLKILIDDVLRRLDTLISILESREYCAWGRGEVSRLKDTIIRARKPLVPSRTVWERYTVLVALIEEISKLADNPGYEYALYSSLLSLRERVTEFKDVLEKAYVMEKVQVALPAVLGFMVTAIRIVSVGLDFELVYLAVSTASLILTLLKPILGLTGTVALGILLIALEAELSSALTGTLLVVISMTYIYLLLLARSSKFEKKIKDAVRGVEQLLQTLAPEQAKIDDVITLLLEAYSVDDTGIFKYLDKRELLRYKAGLLVALGLAPKAPVLHSNKSHE